MPAASKWGVHRRIPGAVASPYFWHPLRPTVLPTTARAAVLLLLYDLPVLPLMPLSGKRVQEMQFSHFYPRDRKVSIESKRNGAEILNENTVHLLQK